MLLSCLSKLDIYFPKSNFIKLISKIGTAVHTKHIFLYLLSERVIWKNEFSCLNDKIRILFLDSNTRKTALLEKITIEPR